MRGEWLMDLRGGNVIIDGEVLMLHAVLRVARSGRIA